MKTALDLPIRLGLTDGSNATLLVDGSGNAFGQLFGIDQGVSVTAARKDKSQAAGVNAGDLIVRAVNNYEDMVFAMKHIASTAQHKRIANYATAALVAANEIKAPH
jgi:hypothetical protein